MTGQSWRLIPLLDAPGAFHMALDEWLLDQHLHHGHPPTLRFYTWNPPAISLGVSQRRQIPHHWHQITWQGQPLQLVQRPTGGRGVLHQGDLTYAIVTSQLPGSREQVYRYLCQFLIAGWQRLGVDLHFGSTDRPYLRSHSCFGLATPADLVTAQGVKLIGSAQLQREQAILQHGSMALNGDPALFEQVFQTALGPWSRDRGTALPALPALVEGLTQAAANCLGGEFIRQPLSPAEWQAVEARAATKKGSMPLAIKPMT
jgi:lipoate---protein ligase